MDDTTLITQTAAPLPKVSERREAFARRVQLSPVQKLTRAHLAANARPQLSPASLRRSALRSRPR
jgi:hypothetical protein